MSDIDSIIANVLGHDKATDWAGRTRRDEYYRTAAPLLAAEVERLRAEIDRMKRTWSPCRVDGDPGQEDDRG